MIDTLHSPPPGSAFNQLAVLVGSKNNHLDSIYYYQRRYDCPPVGYGYHLGSSAPNTTCQSLKNAFLKFNSCSSARVGMHHDLVMGTIISLDQLQKRSQ